MKKSIFADLHNSVSTYQNFHRERELTLTHLAELLADLPNLRALMTTQHEATIQDGSTDLWRLGGSDLFVLADRTGKVVALHTATPGFSREMAQQSLSRPSESGRLKPVVVRRRSICTRFFSSQSILVRQQRTTCWDSW